jgi:hypothetical protein
MRQNLVIQFINLLKNKYSEIEEYYNGNFSINVEEFEKYLMHLL